MITAKKVQIVDEHYKKIREDNKKTLIEAIDMVTVKKAAEITGKSEKQLYNYKNGHGSFSWSWEIAVALDLAKYFEKQIKKGVKYV